MTQIARNDSYNPAHNEQEIAFQGDRDLWEHELRRIFPVQDAKIQRVGDSLYPEGYITDGLEASVAAVTNLLAPSNDFTSWTLVGGATVQAAYAPDRWGRAGKASRLVGLAGQDAYMERLVPGEAQGRKVFAIDLLSDATDQVRLSLLDGGGAEVAVADFQPQGLWSRAFITLDDEWLTAGDVTVRVRPGVPPLSGSVIIAAAQLEDVGDGPLAPGVYVETIDAPATAPGSVVTINAGTAYAKGLPRPVAGGTIQFDPLKASGVDLIFLEVAERYVLGTVDESLEDPLTGLPGNDSVREETKLEIIDTTDLAVPADPIVTNPQYRSRYAVALFQFDRATGLVTPVAQNNHVRIEDTVGLLPGPRVAPQSIPEDRLDLKATEGQPGLLAAQARRMRNAAGAFVVPHQGDVPTITQDLAVTAHVQAKIEPLDGYTPDGRSHYLDQPEIVTLPLQTTTARRRGEAHVYYTGTDTYRLAKQPVESIEELECFFRVTQNVVRGAVPGGQDELANTPVFQILTISQGATSYDGSPGGDYIQVGDMVDWSPNGAGANEPAIGSTYQVVYLYKRQWPAGEFTFDGESITFAGANRPEPTLPFEVTYQYGQDRVDLILLTNEGLAVLSGTPSDHPTPPPVPRGAMALWEAVVGYQALGATFRPRFTVGVPMERLAGMQSTLAALAYNVAQLAASVGLRDRLGTLKGSITDPFADDRQLDPLAQFYTDSGNAVARIDGGRLKMARASSMQKLAVSPESTFQVVGAWAGLPYTVASPADLKNDQYSGDVSVNPFANFDLIPPLISLSTQAWGWGGGFLATITLSGVRFQPNEANIPVKVDGAQVTTVNADANGRISLTLNRFVSASTIIEVAGAGGSPRVTVGSNIRWPRRDPAGQTFVTSRAGDILGVRLHFTAKDNTQPVVVTLRTVVAGLPTEEIVPGTLKELLPSQVNVGGFTDVFFDRPIPAEGDVGYAVVAASNSSAYRLQLAQLGKANLGPGGGYITKNPYGRGVFVESSDGRAWTPQQDKDLRFAIFVAAYDTSGPKTLLFDALAFPGGVTSFELAAAASVAQGASLRWEYSLDPAAPAPTWIGFNPGALDAPNTIALGEVATELRVRAIAASTDPYAGVAINVENLNLTAHLAETLASYVQKQTTLLEATDTVKAFTKVALKTGTSVSAHATVDGGATWLAGTLVSTRQLDQELAEQEWSFAFGVAGTAFRGRLDLEGTSTLSPEVEEVSFVVQ